MLVSLLTNCDSESALEKILAALVESGLLFKSLESNGEPLSEKK